MNRIALLLFVLAAFLVAGCGSTVDVRTDFSKTEDFGTLKTWSWLPPGHTPENPMAQNPALAKRVREALHRELTAKGYEWVDSGSDADFHIGFHTSMQEKQDIAVQPQSYYYAYRGASWGAEGVQAYQYYEGSLVVDIVDTGKNELVWRGWASAVVTPGEQDDERLREAIQGLMAEFPPEAGQ